MTLLPPVRSHVVVVLLWTVFLLSVGFTSSFADGDDECVDDPAWATDAWRTCYFVSWSPARRCRLIGSDGRPATEACRLSCDDDCATAVPSLSPTSSSPPTPSPTPLNCENDPDWYAGYNASRTCDYVAERPYLRCTLTASIDGVYASRACPGVCNPLCVRGDNNNDNDNNNNNTDYVGVTNLDTLTSSPTNSQTRASSSPPTPSTPPTPSPTPLNCENDPDWYAGYNASRTCDYVAERPYLRCTLAASIDGVYASRACPGACNPLCVWGDNDNHDNNPSTNSPGGDDGGGVFVSPPPTPLNCENDPDWHGAYDTSYTCDYVAERPVVRCRVTFDEDGVSAARACPGVCDPTCRALPTISPAPSAAVVCENDDDWTVVVVNYANGAQETRSCDYVAEWPLVRCPAVYGSDGRPAREACVDVCHPACRARRTDAPTPLVPTPAPSVVCEDDEEWHALLRPDRDCDWVSGLPALRCGRPDLVSLDLRDPTRACPATCHEECQPPSLVEVVTETTGNAAAAFVGALTIVVQAGFGLAASTAGAIVGVAGAALGAVLGLAGGALGAAGSAFDGLLDVVSSVFEGDNEEGD